MFLKGYQLFYVAPLSQVYEEMGLLLLRNRTYKVTNISPMVEKNKAYTMVDAKILDIPSNYCNKRAANVIYENSLPSLSK
ncbi:ADP-ribosyltransferase [Bacillus cereus]